MTIWEVSLPYNGCVRLGTGRPSWSRWSHRRSNAFLPFRHTVPTSPACHRKYRHHILEILELINDHCQLPGAGCVQQGLEQLREPHRNTEDGEIELSLICWRKSSQSAFSAIRLTNRYTKDFPSKAWRSNLVFPIRRLPVTMVNTACVCDYLFRSSKSPSS